MVTFWQRLFRTEPESAPPKWAQELTESLADLPAATAELVELVQKTSRAQARLSLKCEDLEHKVEGGFAELRAARPLAAAVNHDVSPVLDALDALAEAQRSATEPSLAEGLSGVRRRLEAFLEQLGVKRHAPTRVPADGRLFKVVGTEPSDDTPEDAIVRVVRAAATQGEEVIREGSVIINRRNP